MGLGAFLAQDFGEDGVVLQEGVNLGIGPAEIGSVVAHCRCDFDVPLAEVVDGLEVAMLKVAQRVRLDFGGGDVHIGTGSQSGVTDSAMKAQGDGLAVHDAGTVLNDQSAAAVRELVLLVLGRIHPFFARGVKLSGAPVVRALPEWGGGGAHAQSR